MRLHNLVLVMCMILVALRPAISSDVKDDSVGVAGGVMPEKRMMPDYAKSRSHEEPTAKGVLIDTLNNGQNTLSGGPQNLTIKSQPFRENLSEDGGAVGWYSTSSFPLLDKSTVPFRLRLPAESQAVSCGTLIETKPGSKIVLNIDYSSQSEVLVTVTQLNEQNQRGDAHSSYLLRSGTAGPLSETLLLSDSTARLLIRFDKTTLGDFVLESLNVSEVVQ